MAGPITAALRYHPIVELRAALQVQAFQEIAGEQVAEPAQAGKIERLQSVPHRRFDLHRVDQAVRQVERDHVASGRDADMFRLVENRPEPAQAPAQFALGIVRNIAE